MDLSIRRISSPQGHPPVRSYLEIVRDVPIASIWFDRTTEITEKLDLDRLSQSQVNRALIHSLIEFKNLHGVSIDNASVTFESSDQIENITGHRLRLPKITFSDEASYRAFMEKLGGSDTTQGTTTSLDYSMFLRRLGIPSEIFSKPLRIAIFCKEQIPNSRPPKQIERHEIGHSLDPRCELRRVTGQNNPGVLNELVAVVSEFATNDPWDNHSKLSTSPIWWSRYITEHPSPAMKKVLKLDQEEPTMTVDVVNALSSFVSRVSGGELGNINLVRVLMECDSFDDLLVQLGNIFPAQYPEEKDTMFLTGQQRIRLLTKVLEKVGYYYQHWPGVYALNNRSIISIWQEKTFANQAMSPFLDSKELLGIKVHPWSSVVMGVAALQLIEQLSNHKFDCSNITKFNVTKTTRPGDGATIITVSW